MADIVPDNNAALDFLQHWLPSGPWVLSAIAPEREKKLGMVTQTFTKPDLALAFIKTWNGKRNIYFNVNLPREHMTIKPGKKDIAWLTALHVDVDPQDGKDLVNERTRILLLLQQVQPKPTVILFSGGGYQAFWLLTNSVEVRDIPHAEQLELYNRQISKEVGGDRTHNLDRIMRLPGTINLPDAKKLAKGRHVALAYVVEADWDLVYDLSAFKQLDAKTKPSTASGAANDDAPEAFPLPEWAMRVLENGPDHEGKHSYNNDRSKALWAVTCAMVRANWSEKQIVAAILDKDNKLSEHVYDQANAQTYAERQAAKAKESAGGEFIFNSKGMISSNQQNIMTALGKLGVRVSYNEFSYKPMVEGPDERPFRVMQDEDTRAVWLKVEKEFGFRPAREYFRDVIEDFAMQTRYHPIRTYIDGLQWDGKPRIDTWLIDLGGAVDTPYVRAVGALMLLAGVRRVRQPGCKFDEIMIFVSKQGTNKSSAISCLAIQDEWFSDSLPLNAKDKEVIELLSGKWIIEIAELKGLKNSDIEHLKAFTARQWDRARLAFGRLTAEVPRQCIMFATTNSMAFLKDPTGNRRFWPVEVIEFDLAKLRACKDQLWAEAAYRESSGASIRLAPALYDAAAEIQDKHRQEDEGWEDPLRWALEPYPDGKISSADIWTILDVPVERRSQHYSIRISEIMTLLGWEKKNIRLGVTGHQVVRKGYVKGRGDVQITAQRDDHRELQITDSPQGFMGESDLEAAAPKSGPGDIPF